MYSCVSVCSSTLGPSSTIPFYSGVRYAMQKAREMGVEPHVLDIGTGTGLLSLMAAKCGIKKITACEVSPPSPMYVHY